MVTSINERTVLRAELHKRAAWRVSLCIIPLPSVNSAYGTLLATPNDRMLPVRVVPRLPERASTEAGVCLNGRLPERWGRKKAGNDEPS